MIIFNSVYRTFDPDDSGLKDISFTIDPGELVMITGHSGSGKTTIMRLLTKEYTPNKGEISFDEQNLSKIKKSKLHEHRRKIGVVFQDYRLIPEMNVWENIALPLAITGKKDTEIAERVTDLLNLIQLPEKAHLFPSQLSGGEAQRISIARALANAARVIFADEPTGNLDQDTSQSIAHLLKQINELGTTLIFATHDPKVLSIFSDKRHINLKNGTVEFDTGEKKPNSAKKDSKNEDKDTDKKASEKEESTNKKSANITKSSSKESSVKSETTTGTSEPESKDTSEKDTKEEKSEKPAKKSGGLLSRWFGSKESKTATEKTNADGNDLDIEMRLVETDSKTEDTKNDDKTSVTMKDEKTSKKINTANKSDIDAEKSSNDTSKHKSSKSKK